MEDILLTIKGNRGLHFKGIDGELQKNYVGTDEFSCWWVLCYSL
jgi:hypothetical protein